MEAIIKPGKLERIAREEKDGNKFGFILDLNIVILTPSQFFVEDAALGRVFNQDEYNAFVAKAKDKKYVLMEYRGVGC